MLIVGVFFFSACGGSSGGGDNPPVSPSSPFDTVQNAVDGERIYAGIYTGDGINYYDLVMPSSGNLVISAIGAYTASLYDENLNLIKGYFYPSEPTALKAGKYILQVNYDKRSTISINSNALYDQNQLPEITSGTYSGIGAKFYKLNMATDGNILLGVAGAYKAAIYDTNLNLIQNYFRTSESTALKAGTYILKFDYNYVNSITVKVN